MFVCCVLLISGCGGYEIESETEKLYMRGKIVTFDVEMLYMKCKTETYSDIENSLFWLIEEEYIRPRKDCVISTASGIKRGMRFEVKDSYLKKPWGFYKPFNSISRYLILQDEEGRRSIFPEIGIKVSGTVTN